MIEESSRWKEIEENEREEEEGGKRLSGWMAKKIKVLDCLFRRLYFMDRINERVQCILML